MPLDAGGPVITGCAARRGVATVLRSSSLPIGGRSHDPFVALALRVLAAAPAPLRAPRRRGDRGRTAC